MQAWSPFYWADYVADTSQLSLVEHGAYFMLMAHYYNTRKPLPANASILHRVCRATTDAEQEAVAVILTAYFRRDGEFYYHNRIDKELAKSLQISEVRRNAAHKRYVAKAHAKDMQKQVHLHTQSQSQSQEPNTKAKATSAFDLPEWVPKEAWDHYEEMRRKIRKPMTDQARIWGVSQLTRLRAQGHDPRGVLEQSVFNSWQGLFPIGGDRHDSHNRKAETFGQIAVSNTRRAAEAVLARSGVSSEPRPALNVQPGTDGAGLRALAATASTVPAKGD